MLYGALPWPFFLAGFGSVEDVDWTGLVRAVDADRHSDVSDWQGDEPAVRLGTVSKPLARCEPRCAVACDGGCGGGRSRRRQ